MSRVLPIFIVIFILSVGAAFSALMLYGDGLIGTPPYPPPVVKKVPLHFLKYMSEPLTDIVECEGGQVPQAMHDLVSGAPRVYIMCEDPHENAGISQEPVIFDGGIPYVWMVPQGVQRAEITIFPAGGHGVISYDRSVAP